VGSPTNIGKAVPRVDSGPLADRVRTLVLEAILDGRFTERLPAEGELAKMLDVSRTTLRTALSGLERDGIVTRRRAVGTTINSHVSAGALALQRHVGFDYVLRKSGRSVQIDVEFGIAPPPGDLAEHFELDRSADHLAISKAYRADGVVAVWLRDIVPVKSLRTRPANGDLPPSLSELSRQHGHRAIDHAVARVLATVNTNSITQLEIPQGRAFTRLLETHYASDAEVFGYSVIDVDDGFVQLEVFRRETR
jgi:GntR family transcriptional regulator